MVFYEGLNVFCTNLIDMTSHPLATAYLHILEPMNPLPPHTMIFLAAAFDMMLLVALTTLV